MSDDTTPPGEQPVDSVEAEQEAGKPVATPIPASESREAFIKLGLVILAIAGLAVATQTWKTVLVVFIVIGMIMVHEFGHFVMARRAGMKCTEFFLGFGPRLWSVKRGETEYGIKGLPLGGYVKIIGMANIEEVPPEDEPRTYRQKSFGARLSVAVAGSFTHLLMAYLILVALTSFVGFEHRTNEIGAVNAGRDVASPAQAAGLEPGDKVVAIDGKPVKQWLDIPKSLKGKVDQPVTVAVERDGKPMTFNVTPVDGSKFMFAGTSRPAYGEPTAVLGVGASKNTVVVKESLVKAIPESAQTIGSASVMVVKALGQIFSPSGIADYFQLVADTPPTLGNEEVSTTPNTNPQTANPSTPAGSAQPSAPSTQDQTETNRFLSPVGLVNIINDAANAGIREVLIFLLSFNLFIGIFNMIPLLPFDGGHVAVATYERIRSRKGRRYTADFAKLLPVSYCVLLILVFITLSAMYLDIFNPIANQFE